MKGIQHFKQSFDNQQLNSIFDAMVDTMIVINDEGIILKINPAGLQLFQYKERELIGKKVNILMPSPDRTRHDRYMYNYHQTGQAHIIGTGRDVMGRKKDGSLFSCRLSVNEFPMKETLCYVGIIHDLTKRKSAEHKIKQLNEKLKERVNLANQDLSEMVKELRAALEKERELNELKSRFVTMASHQFRTPLSTIRSSNDLVKKYIERNQMDKIPKHFKRINTAVKDLTDMVGDVLSITQLEEGKVEVQRSAFDLYEMLEETKETSSVFLKENQKLDFQIPVEKMNLVLDKKLYQQIILNLLSNAAKYSEEGQTIFFKLKVLNDQLLLKVKDEGKGIPRHEQKHLFTRFFRASNVTNTKGTGLGLNIVKRYVDLLDGSIYFESEEGEGTQFTVVIPFDEV